MPSENKKISSNCLKLLAIYLNISIIQHTFEDMNNAIKPHTRSSSFIQQMFILSPQIDSLPHPQTFSSKEIFSFRRWKDFYSTEDSNQQHRKRKKIFCKHKKLFFNICFISSHNCRYFQSWQASLLLETFLFSLRLFI